MPGIGWRIVFAAWGRHTVPCKPAQGRAPPAPLGQLGWWVPFIYPGQWYPHYWSWETGLPGEMGEVGRITRLAMWAQAIREATERP